MNIKNKNIVITGGCNGIGEEIVKQFSAKGARIVVGDISNKINKINNKKNKNFLGVYCDVTCEKNIRKLVKKAEKFFGPIDLFISNAGIMKGEKKTSTSANNKLWQLYWNIHVMSHVYAARATLPSMIKRKRGYFLQIISAAALLTQVGDAAYSASKSAALSFAESLAISHADDGIKVSVVCSQYVKTKMISNKINLEDIEKIKSTKEIVKLIINGIEAEKFLIITDDNIQKYVNYKINNYDKWLTKMINLRRKALTDSMTINVKEFYKFL